MYRSCIDRIDLYRDVSSARQERSRIGYVSIETRFESCIEYVYRGARSIRVFGIVKIHEIHARYKGKRQKNGGGARHNTCQKKGNTRRYSSWARTPRHSPSAHRHAELVLGLRVAEQPPLHAPGARAVVLVGLDSLPRCACPGVRRRAGGAWWSAGVMVERAAGPSRREEWALATKDKVTLSVFRVFYSVATPPSARAIF